MLALYRAGRQAEALEAYRRTRATLVDELGSSRARSCSELERAILRQDPELEPGRRRTARAEPAGAATAGATGPPAAPARGGGIVVALAAAGLALVLTREARAAEATTRARPTSG